MHYWLQLFTEQLQRTTFWEWVAVLLGIAEVLLAMVNSVWLYPAGLISTLITIYYLLAAQLYADSVLNIYYVVMSIYGWYYWLKKSGQPALPITYSNRRDWVVTLLISTGGWLVFYVLLKYVMPCCLSKYFTPSNVPVWDALVSSTAWAGTWLLARRKMENWLLLNVSNLFAVPLLFYKQLPLFAMLTLVLFVLAFFGYADWRKIYRKQTPVLT